MQQPGSLDQKAINEKSINVAVIGLKGKVTIIKAYRIALVVIITGQLNANMTEKLA
jgi:hypothetical protein